MVDAFIGTETGVYHLHDGELSDCGLRAHRISTLHAVQRTGGATTLLAGTYGDGLFQSEDRGERWDAVSEGLTTPVFRSIVPDRTMPGAILCDMEPARIFRSLDGGLTWTMLPGIESHEDAESWYLPYSPRAGAVRTIYSPPGSNRLLGALDVGGLLDSRDGGETWECPTILGNGDIHFVSGHPSDPDYLITALGWAKAKNHPPGPDDPPLGGIGVSQDGGRTWRASHSDYTRAVIIPPTHPDLLLAGPAKKVGGLGRIDVSHDGGQTWQPASDSIDTPMQDMVETFEAAPDGTIWAICDGGRLLAAEPGDWRWRSVLPEGAGIKVQSVTFIG